MSQHDDAGLDVAALLAGVCSAILEEAVGNDGRELGTGEFISPAAVEEVHAAVRVGLPMTPDHDRYMFATGICTGLAAAVRHLEATAGRAAPSRDRRRCVDFAWLRPACRAAPGTRQASPGIRGIQVADSIVRS